MTTQVNLNAAINANLLSLQNTQTLLNQTQLSLSTGKKVNSALDNPGAFFSAQALTNRSGDLSNVLDGISQGVQTIQTANDGITAITSLLQQAQSVAQQALSESNANAGGAPTDQTSLQNSFNQILAQITNLANDASYQGTNLLNSATNSLTLTYDETGKSTQTIQGVNFTAGSTGTGNYTNSTTTGSALSIAGTTSPVTGSAAFTSPPITGTVSLPAPPTDVGSGVDDFGIDNNEGSIDFGLAFNDSTQLVNSINSYFASVHGGIAASLNVSGQLVLTSSNPNDVTQVFYTSGNGQADIGIAPGNYLAAQSGGSTGDSIVVNGQTVLVGNLSQTQILSNLNAAGASAGFSATINGSNQLQISATGGHDLNIANGAGTGLADVGLTATAANGTGGQASDSVVVNGQTIQTGQLTQAQLLSNFQAAGVAGHFSAHYNGNQLVLTSTTNSTLTVANGSGSGLAEAGLSAGTYGAQTGGLNIANASFGAAGNIQASLASIAAALTSVRAQASTLGQNLGTVQTYQSFNTNLINDLNAGANDLTAADTNQESAALLTLQTQQQLGISALSLASQAQQAVLKLFP